MELGHTIAVVDRSGKVISTSRALLGIFKEAKAAYREKKAEIFAERQVEIETKQAQRALEGFTLEEQSVVTRTKTKTRRQRPSRRSTDGGSRRGRGGDDTLVEEDRRTAVSSLRASVVRRHSAYDGQAAERDPMLSRSASFPTPQRNLARSDSFPDPQRDLARSGSFADPPPDMDLAYGELPPPDNSPVESELKTLMSRVTKVLDEAQCVQYSVSATVEALENDPEAMAAVALALAEISNLVSKLGPAALMTMKGSFPAVFALLASPQFMIAAGVGVGVVVVAFGGYKIIKKIRQRMADEEEEETVDHLQEIDVDVNRIDAWRRGVADCDTASVGTSVSGEFITPEAAAIRRAEGDTEIGSGRHRKKKSRKSSKSTRSKKEEGKVREKRTKEPSKLRLLFHHH